ncbi:MAG TPA: hypothetical protein VEB21_06975, partial [Terriglobales bacterium]|nr:hypothetical protein [Terriglobales bacterium]
MIHYLAPRGLEQYSGGGWGTRDVCQGPLELLLAIGEWQPIRQLLQSVFEQQNPDGDWPQWFMFFDRERNIRPGDSHGDIIFWPLLALAEYLLASDDAALLDEVIPFFDRRGKDRGEPATIWRHVERALAAIEQRLIPHTALAAYGRGDWNDSLQPVDPAMSESLCSAWTVALHYQTSNRLAQALRHSGRDRAAAQLETAAAAIRRDYQRYLLPDGTVAAYAHFPGDGEPEYLLHPRDSSTGIHYSLLAMSYGILSELFTPEQAYRHARAIAEHLLAPDGARLFDRPFPYRGGPQKTFQRAESSSFFGREIGIMYMHANLRYAEAMAHYGDAGAFWRALQLANPIGIEELVASARRRQANCYYSSSDADFADRYQAEAEYERVKRGAVALEGGWRIYSSGAGIAVRLIVQCFLGLRRGHSQLTIDPVLPTELDGLEASTRLEDCEVRLVYRSGSRGCGPVVIELNGAALPFTREANPYRVGGACVAVEELRRRLKRRNNTLRIELL